MGNVRHFLTIAQTPSETIVRMLDLAISLRTRPQPTKRIVRCTCHCGEPEQKEQIHCGGRRTEPGQDAKDQQVELIDTLGEIVELLSKRVAHMRRGQVAAGLLQLLGDHEVERRVTLVLQRNRQGSPPQL